jgi:signal transduction histidine kinase/uncharacterized membrane protein
VLQVISSSPGDLQPVFQAMLANATRLCQAGFGTLNLYDGDVYRNVALHNPPPQYAVRRGQVIRPHPESALGYVARTKQIAHIDDVRTRQPYVEGNPAVVALADLAGARTLLAVPLLKEGELIGAISIYRQEVRPFTDKQIELVQNFAAQAVIAIENVRLFKELRQRTDDLSESLEQQTATSQVLQVISSSRGELEPVFEALLENATRLCAAKFGNLYLWEGDVFRTTAMHNVPAAFAEARARDPIIRPGPHSMLGRVASTKQAVHIPDAMQDEGYINRTPLFVSAVELGGFRALLAVPMLKDGNLIGVITIYRQEAGPFSGKQIELVTNFAAQAVIAIENTRLLNELRQSLQQQTATADVLKVISRSTFDLQTVLQTLVESAARLCDAEKATITRQKDGAFYRAEAYGFSREFMDYFKDIPIVADRGSSSGRALLEGRVVHIPDVRADPEYTFVEGQKLGDFRTVLSVPMLREGIAIGVLALTRSEVRPFSEKQIELVTTFADQAVIAIENVRLFDELQARTEDLAESLQQQIATADVLKVISRSAFNLQRVLETLLESAVRICGSKHGLIFHYDGESCHAVASYNTPSGYLELWKRTPIRAGRGTTTGRALLERRPVQIADVQADPDYDFPEAQKLMGYRTVLAVPLLRDGIPLGVIGLWKTEVAPFSDKQIEMLVTFADQAVIAIENSRLFDEIQEKSRQLAEASKHKSQFLANMSHELRTPLNAILGYTELILDQIYGDTPDKMRSVLTRIQSNGKHLLGLINDVLDLSKIEAGQLTLSLSDYSLKDIIQTVFTAIEPLATEKKIALKIDVATQLPPGHGDERRLTQVLLNLVGNAIKFTDVGEVSIKGSAANGSFNVSVCDTGPGISPVDQAKLFEEFQQADNSITKQKGGTGLGLAISKRIIELHGGRIWLESNLGHGSTFAFTLPVTVEKQARPA